METTINKLSDVEFELDIQATNESLEPLIENALKDRRPQVTMKGFRPGHVPVSLLRKLIGKEVAYQVIDQVIQEQYQKKVVDSPDLDVMGSPTVTTLDYEPDGDLHAALRFGVRPEFEIGDLTKVSFTRYVRPVTDEDVEQEIQNLLESKTEAIPHDDAAGEDDLVTVDAQRLDAETDTPIIGERHEDVTFYLGHPEIDPDLKKRLIGVKKGDAVKAELPDPDGGETADARSRFLLSVVDTKRRQVPELDDDFVKELTGERFGTVDELREDVRHRMESQWNRAIEESFEDEVITKLVDFHDFEVPSSIVDTYLDWYVENVRRQGDGNLPEGFDEEDFRTNRRDEAEKMARWMLIRQKIVDSEDLEVTDEELDEAFDNKDAEEGQSGASMRMLFQQHYPDMIEQMERRILNRKLFESIAAKSTVEEKEWQVGSAGA